MTTNVTTMAIAEPAEDPLAAFMRLVDGLAQRHAEPTVQRSVPRYPFNVAVAIHVQSLSGRRTALVRPVDPVRSRLCVALRPLRWNLRT